LTEQSSWLDVLLQRFSPLRRKRLLKLLDLSVNTTLPAEGGPFLLAVLAHFLEVKQKLSNEQRELLLDELCQGIRGFGASLHAALKYRQSKLPVSQLMIADDRLVRMSGAQHFLDLQTGEYVIPSGPFVLYQVIDLTALYCTYQAWLENRRACDNAPPAGLAEAAVE
jgi:hypothetical protein